MRFIADRLRELLSPELAHRQEDPAEMSLESTIDISRFLCPSAPVGINWSSFHDPGPIRRWVGDVRAAIDTGSEDDWLIAGPALAIESEDPEELETMLRFAASESGIRLARIPDEEFGSLLGLRTYFESLSPIIVQVSVRSLLQAFQSVPEPQLNVFARDSFGRFRFDRPVVIAGWTDSISQLDRSLLGWGLMDRQVRLAPPDKGVLGQRFLDSFSAELVSDELRQNAAKVGLLLRGHYRSANERRLAALQLRRIARGLERKLEFSDVVNLALRGSVEHSPEAVHQPTQDFRRKVAYHEAGHACIAVIESKGKAIPDYASIVPSADFAGVVMESLHYQDGVEEFTFSHLLLRIRVGLAGRAAEELFFGSPNVSDGPDSDLFNATQLAYAFFARSGFHASMVRNGVSGMNLAVETTRDIDPVQNDRIVGEVRVFLSDEYAHVIRTLQEHREFVDAVVDRLMWDPVVDQQEMTEIASKFGLIGSSDRSKTVS